MEVTELRAELAALRAEADAALAASKQAHGTALRTVQQQADGQFAELEGALSAMEQQLAVQVAELHAARGEGGAAAAARGERDAATIAKLTAELEAEKRKAAAAEGGTVRVVVQRADRVEVLLDNDARWARCGRCLVLFVSFAKGATSAALPKVVQTLLRIPIATLGQWATHSEVVSPEQAPRSILSFVQAAYADEVAADRAARERGAKAPPREPRGSGGGGEKSGSGSEKSGFLRFLSRQAAEPPRCPVSIVVIPQAGLTSKIAPTGHGALKYHAQAGKALGAALYAEFVGLLRAQTRAAVHGAPPPTGAALGADFERRKQERAAQSCVDPATMFRAVGAGGAFEGKFGAWDDATGLPTHDAAGEPLAKSQLKKLKKAQQVQASKFEKARKRRLEEGEAAAAAPAAADRGPAAPAPAPAPGAGSVEARGDDVVRVIAGTFGNRQGFRMVAECGPFVHTFAF
jgi:hypothetical protein